MHVYDEIPLAFEAQLLAALAPWLWICSFTSTSGVMYFSVIESFYVLALYLQVKLSGLRWLNCCLCLLNSCSTAQRLTARCTADPRAAQQAARRVRARGQRPGDRRAAADAGVLAAGAKRRSAAAYDSCRLPRVVPTVLVRLTRVIHRARWSVDRSTQPR